MMCSSQEDKRPNNTASRLHHHSSVLRGVLGYGIVRALVARSGRMTVGEFRKLALSFPHTTEREHMRHPDFRVAGKIFATLAYPDKNWGMVKLTPDQQEEFVGTEPKVFVAVKG